jgi:ankyrin repeat protein
VTELIEAGADPNYSLKWDENFMPLYTAASVGNLDIIKLLTKAGADVNCVHHGNYALEVAAMSGHDEVYKYLYPLTAYELREGKEEDLMLAKRGKHIEELADPEVVELNRVIFGNDLAIFEKIVGSVANINSHDSYGNTPLIEACTMANSIMVRKLLALGANPNTKNYDNETPLMRVVSARKISDCTEICRELIQAGADIDAQDNDGKTALMNACNMGCSGCIELLLDSGADINAQDNDGKTALMNACNVGCSDCVKLLLNSVAIKSIQDNDGRVALDYAFAHSQLDYSWADNVDYSAVINLLEE